MKRRSRKVLGGFVGIPTCSIINGLRRLRKVYVRMQSIEIDPELNRLALVEAAEQYPEFAGLALRVVARPLSRGFAWQL
jgi:hypothetical protein